jgi:hypothetical protein
MAMSSMKKRIFLILALVTPLWGFFGPSTGPKGDPPEVLDVYAAKKIRPGVSWRVYLHARDADGDMKDVASMLYVPGFGFSPTTFTRLKKEDRDEFVGYLFLRTPPDNSLLGEKFELRVFIRDKRGNRSEPVKLTVTFDSVAPETITEKWQAATEHRLGGIMIDIQSFSDWRRF